MMAIMVEKTEKAAAMAVMVEKVEKAAAVAKVAIMAHKVAIMATKNLNPKKKKTTAKAIDSSPAAVANLITFGVSFL